ncbi:MAG: hypothetical protein D8M57_09360 [Candidatus Scalindua sp. AMX11]|nr:MAG: hypothetical protein DWQ00_00410 [Candidatus Scalindua sp.]RZV79595.1 MAG: hypothetical protein EX341_11220 [Candidatus Scalindua sp. SCAELEC01]TDE65237.1 MAG: hypothetical protein D8M57_09360 [Candidatus Scalindua sp. AMX11]GJQ57428.1 MAG: hypothetical protein SCALA701_02290 [Candidatus Scalindua sp.]
MEDKRDNNLDHLMEQIEVEQGLAFLRKILPECNDLQNILAKLMHDFYTSLCKEGFTKSQAIEIIKAHGTGINSN